ncbi:MAG: hypothetical protein J5J06_00205 [Phycisphaerae bacterium]|nr:hypothetical protein [Phycisphaerae bacterium]
MGNRSRGDSVRKLPETLIRFVDGCGAKPLSLPIPIDYFAEQMLGLDLLWDEVEELPGELILGAIMPE